MKAMILAAGRGERMRPLTDATPKPLLPVAGRALLDYHIQALARAGIVQIVINLSWQGEQIRDHVGDGSRFGVSVQFSPEGPEPLETGGGILRALPLLGEDAFWLVNGDVYCDYRYTPGTLPPDVLAHLIMVPNPPHNPDGDFALHGDRVCLSGSPILTYSGIAVLSGALVADCAPGKFPLAPLLTAAADRGQVTGELFSGLWRDVGTPERLQDLDRKLTGSMNSRQ